MNGLLLDSDVVIEVLRLRDPVIVAQWERLAVGDEPVFYTPVTSAEIWHGVRPGERASVEALFSAMTCVPIDDAIGKRAGGYLQEFRRSHRLELGDTLIAATATVHRLPLWTRNRRHYPMKDLVLWGP